MMRLLVALAFSLLATAASAQVVPNQPNQPNLGAGVIVAPRANVVPLPGNEGGHAAPSVQTYPNGFGSYNIQRFGRPTVICYPNAFGGVNCN
jgi:hypothetical protein